MLTPTIQAQYKNTNIETLLNLLGELFEKYTHTQINDFFTNYYDLNTASGLGLDMWGKILNFPRVINYKIEKDDTELTYILQDDEYRVILKLLALQTRTNCTVPEINIALQEIFSNFGETSAFCMDYQRMRYTNYVFMFQIPKWMRAVFLNYEVLPHPGGVGVKFTEAYFRIIGFKGKGKGIGNFYNTVFFKPPALEEDILGFKGSVNSNFQGANFKNPADINPDNLDNPTAIEQGALDI